MAKYRIVGGKLLLVAGKATRGNCCCGACCSFTSERTLYLTIDNFTLDNDACPDCVGFSVSGYPSFDIVTNPGAVWFSQFIDPCFDTAPYIFIYGIQCDVAGEYGPAGMLYLEMPSGGSSAVLGEDCLPICDIYLKDDGYGPPFSGWQPLGMADCTEPFYLQATVNVVIYIGGVECDTGTMRITVTE